MAYVKINVLKPSDNKGTGGNKKDKIILFDMDDLLNFPDRDANGVLITDNLVFKANAYMITLFATITSIVGGNSSEGDLDAEGFVQSLSFDHPGSSKEIREFNLNWLPKNIGALVQKCGESSFDLYGSLCAPLRLTSKWEDTKDKNVHNFTFKSMKSSFSSSIYHGAIIVVGFLLDEFGNPLLDQNGEPLLDN